MRNLSRTPAASRPRRRLRSLRTAAVARVSSVAAGKQARRLREAQGFMLIEVVVSTLLIGLIVVATFTGFDVVNRTSADQRRHDQAVLLAAQSQEQLRSDPANALVALETTPHIYTRTVNGTQYTITQEVKAVAATGKSTGCSATETSAQTGGNFRITSKVSWASLGTRPPVKAESLITPPTGSALEVDVTNGESRAVSGVTAKASFVPVEGGGTASEEGTTGAAGCVVLSGIPATKATVEIPEITGFVTNSDGLEYPTKEVSIAPNYTVHYPVTYDRGGKIEAKFTYKGQQTYEREPGKVEKVTGDTFVTYNSHLTSEQKWQVGSTAFEYKAQGTEPKEPYKSAPSGYATTAFTATGSKYPKGNLFPFSSQSWETYAGDCPKNNPGTVTESQSEKIAAEKVVVERAGTTTAAVPMSYVLLNVYSGTEKEPKSLESTAYAVKITDTECEGYATPLNAFGATLAHSQLTSGEGHLTAPFQPFGNASLCLYNPSVSRTYKVSYDNLTVAGSKRNIFLGELSGSEKLAKREAEKTALATRKSKLETEISKRQTEEANLKKAAEAEASAKKTRETTEANERKTWEAEEKAKFGKKITKAEREKKEKEQTEKRKAKEAEEAKNQEKRAAEEKALKTTGEAQAKEKTKLEAEETEASAKWSAEIAEEAKKEDNIESGQSSC